MSKVFDQIRARSSVDALEMIGRQHPETAINSAALREELEAADEQINQLARALRQAMEPPTFMGEPVRQAQPIGFVRFDEKVPGRWVFINFHEARNPDLAWEPVHRTPGVNASDKPVTGESNG